MLFVLAIIGSAVSLTITARLPHRRKKMGWMPGMFVFTLLMLLLPVINMILLLALRPKISDIEAHEQWKLRISAHPERS